MRGIGWCLIAAAVVASGCEGMASENRLRAPEVGSATQPNTTATAPPVLSARPADGQVMAYVNESPVYMTPLYDVLLREHGMGLAKQLIANELVNQAAARRGLTVSEEEIQAERELTLQQFFPQVSEAAQRERLLEHFLERRRLSRESWRMTMRRNVLLGKLAEPQVAVSEAELRDEFGRQYGRQVVVRHIQSATLSEAQDALRRLRAGAKFAELAAKVSKNPSARDGGLLPAIAVKAEGVPPALSRVALAMKKVGEVSEPIQVGTTFHILYLEKIPEPKGVKLDDVKDKLTAAVRAKKLRTLKNRVFAELARAGNIEYVNPILKSQAERDDMRILP